MSELEITSVETISVKKNDVVLVRYARDSMPVDRVLDFTRDIAKKMKDIFPDNKIVIMDSETDITIFSSDDNEEA